VTTSNPFDLSGRVAVVTGGNGGIGGAIALGFARAGAAVGILARNESKNAALLAELEVISRPATAIALDVTDRRALGPAVRKIEAALGPVDILVNNAGASAIGGVLHQTPRDWDHILETNLTAAFLLSKIVAHGMSQRRRGKIINITSEYARFGSAFAPAYSASKGALLQLTKSMAIELAPFNIQVNSIAPGWIETELAAPAKNSPMNDEIVARTPAGRWGQPEELAGAAVFLASSASDFVTGVDLFVDGGYAIR
jgi:2-deoxy-D-gluconate 3-dehydrogenase